MFLQKIISGGQTGADRSGLDAAKCFGLQTGGVAPKGYRTEIGPDLSLKEFGLTESTAKDYNTRTKENVLNSDATLILSTNPASPGTKLTVRLATDNSRPYRIVNPHSKRAANEVVEFLQKYQPRVLNVAGNRESVSPGIKDLGVRILLASLSYLQKVSP